MRRHTRYIGPVGFPAADEAPLATSSGSEVFEIADLGRLARRALRGIVRTARAGSGETLQSRIKGHLDETNSELAVVRDSWPVYDQVNVQLALDDWLIEREHELVGVANYQHQEFGLAELIGGPEQPYSPMLGSISRVNAASGPDGAVTACVACGVYLINDGDARAVVLLRGAAPHMGPVVIEIASSEAGYSSRAVGEIRERALARNVYRGQVLCFGGEVFGPEAPLVQFRHRPTLSRAALILSETSLAAIEHHVIDVTARRERLLANGQHLKRGLLLFGPPGVGKTHTIRYLESRLVDTTVIELSGNALQMVGPACSIARALQPAMVVIEDVDLIAEDRSLFPGGNPMLFQLLNEMDGLAEDADVLFVLTTNRADLLEPALAARPGRVDLAVQIPVPDAEGRHALLALYRGGLSLPNEGLDDIIHRTDGVTASFIKELLRRAAVTAARRDADDAAALHVTRDDLTDALDQLLDTANAMTRVALGGGTAHHTDETASDGLTVPRPAAAPTPARTDIGISGR
jgi:ATPase family associated with various cellular activities (AAA)